VSPAAVEFQDVAKSFGGQRALDGITLQVGEGEVYGLLGPNGSGKTTLIRCILGMLTPDSGAVTVLGKRMPDLGVLSRIGYMTQAAALYPDLTVEENVEFFASINDADAHVDEAIAFTELSDRRRSVVATLSGGMRTRASLACAIVHRPELLLLDEPTVGVDPRLRIQLWDGFQEMADRGTTIVVSSHVMDEAERCQRLGLLLGGKLLAEGTVRQLKAKAGVKKLEDAFLALSEDRAG
jgi:ABC-2 type transport system ATP-binding protein